jgi:hypothetical protein
MLICEDSVKFKASGIVIERGQRHRPNKPSRLLEPANSNTVVHPPLQRDTRSDQIVCVSIGYMREATKLLHKINGFKSSEERLDATDSGKEEV